MFRSIVGMAIGAGLSCAAVSDARACPEVNRLIGPYVDGQLSTIGGAVPNGARAADDFLLPLGNGATWNVRLVKFVMVSNFAITPTNVSMLVYGDSFNGSYQVPGSVVAGAPNSPPTVRDLGVYDATNRLYEVSYAIPAGFLTLSPNAWYWLSPQALAPSGGAGAAYVATANTSVVVGAIACKAFGTPPGSTIGPWSNINECCIGARDLAIYVNAVQTGRAFSDFNCDLVVSPQDLFDFLQAWFASSPTADINGRDGVGVQDIFDFLGLWFAGI